MPNVKEYVKDALDEWIKEKVEMCVEFIKDSVDALGLGGMMVGCFLYMLGIKKGGQFGWLTFAVWVTLKVIFSALSV